MVLSRATMLRNAIGIQWSTYACANIRSWTLLAWRLELRFCAYLYGGVWSFVPQNQTGAVAIFMREGLISAESVVHYFFQQENSDAWATSTTLWCVHTKLCVRILSTPSNVAGAGVYESACRTINSSTCSDKDANTLLGCRSCDCDIALRPASMFACFIRCY